MIQCDSIRGKRLLVLGGTSATFDLVRNAKQMGVYTIVTDDQPTGVTKAIADETAMVSTTDMEGLCQLIGERHIDGAFCGPSEFNIRNLLKLCEKAGLPCYTTTEIWDHCANKDVFKQYCREYGVDCPPEYDVSEHSPDEALAGLDYPIIVKPVDGCSSAGISVCQEMSQVKDACQKARAASKSGRIVVEKYIENKRGDMQEGALFGVRYLLRDGEAYPYFVMDTYIVDPIDKKHLISALTSAPSRYIDYYMKNMDANVRKMLKGMGLRNGTAFFQSLPCNGKIYFHEMGYRLSGGMLYKLTEPLANVNDMQMMIRFALGGEMVTNEELAAIDLHCKGKFGAQLMVPLCCGTIGKIEGLEALKTLPGIVDFIQYYNVGDTLKPAAMGTLGQHFGRFTMILENKEAAYATIKKIQHELAIYDTDGNKMNITPFDLHRIPDYE